MGNRKLFSVSAHGKQGYLLLECIIGLIIATLLIGFVFTIAARLASECKTIGTSAIETYGLSSICDAFEHDIRSSGPIKLLHNTCREISWFDGFTTTSWIVSPDGLRRISGDFDVEKSEWKYSKKTVVSRFVKMIELIPDTAGCRLEIHHANGTRIQRVIEKAL